MAKRKSLGRGLDALLSTESIRDVRGDDGVLRELAVDLLQRGRYQPRVDMRDETLAELAESIRAQGVVQPIVARPLPADGGEQRYEIVAGERRWRAAQQAGLHSIPAIVRDIPDSAAVAVALIENIQREDLNPMEEARALQRLVDDFDMTHASAAEAVGRSRVTVSNLLRLLELPEAVKAMLEQRDLGMGHARALLAVESADELVAVARRVVREGWSVRDTEKAVRTRSKSGRKATKRARASTVDPNVRRLETDLADRLGAQVRIEHAGPGGKVVIRYHSLDELDGIIGHID
ncbi:MAG TPA: ParB/RepB/Spo0J family partition protein [Gammaproteobacteria bacterium]